jgi:hypothetical protein
MCSCTNYFYIFLTVRCLGSILDFEIAKDKKVGPELDELLSHIAKTGRTEYDIFLQIFVDIFKTLISVCFLTIFHKKY